MKGHVCGSVGREEPGTLVCLTTSCATGIIIEEHVMVAAHAPIHSLNGSHFTNSFSSPEG